MSAQNIIIYNTADGKTSVTLMAQDGNVWMNQSQLAELFDTSVPNVSMHISNILKENELQENSVIKNYLTTAADGKNYEVTFYSLDMILAIGFRVRSRRDTQFRQWHALPPALEPTHAGQAVGTRQPAAHAISGSNKCLHPSCEI